jgi:hypothetical protein
VSENVVISASCVFQGVREDSHMAREDSHMAMDIVGTFSIHHGLTDGESQRLDNNIIQILGAEGDSAVDGGHGRGPCERGLVFKELSYVFIVHLRLEFVKI